jgi:hypothetical protein
MPFNTTLRPSQLEIVARPGITLTQAYTVTNNSDSPTILSTSILPWHPQGTTGSVTYDDPPPLSRFDFSLANSDLRLGQSFILRPRESRQLVLKIKSATDTTPGDSYFTFFVNQDPSSQLNSDISGGQAFGRIGSHLLISTSNTQDPPVNLKVKQINVTPRVVDIFFPQINISGLVSNQSDFFTKTVGKLTVSHRSQIVTETDIFPHNVLAHSDRSFNCLSNNLPTTCILHPPFWPGVYTVSLEGVSTQFYVFPFSLILFILLLGSFVYSLIRKNRQI